MKRLAIALVIFASALSLQAAGKRAVIVQTNSAGDNVHVIDAATNKVLGVINGIEVNSLDAAKVDTVGTPGLRVNHNLNLHVEGFAVKSR